MRQRNRQAAGTHNSYYKKLYHITFPVKTKFQNHLTKIRNFYELAPERCYSSCLSDACTPHGECSPDRRQLFRGLLCCAYMVARTERSRREDCLRCVLQCFECKDASSSAARLIRVCESDHLAQLKSHRLVAFYWTDILCEVFSRQKRQET